MDKTFMWQSTLQSKLQYTFQNVRFNMLHYSKKTTLVLSRAVSSIQHHTSTSSSTTTISPSINQYKTPPGWSGLDAWRSSGVNERRVWGDKVPVAVTSPIKSHTSQIDETFSPESFPLAASLAEYGKRVLLSPDPLHKAELTHHAWKEYNNQLCPENDARIISSSNRMPIGCAIPPSRPARPPLPQLLPARQIPTIKQTNLPLNVYTLHNLAHVELNAIDLAWDTVVRFSHLGLPEGFYRDFARVADDESRHLRWCLQRLKELGYEYGCMPAHNLLWEGSEASAVDVRARLAVVPMSQEARGLDAGDRLKDRLVGWGDNKTAAIVGKIAEEERAHVAVGVAWFTALCSVDPSGVDPGTLYAQTLATMCPDLLKGGNFNHDARREVGLLQEWYNEHEWSEKVQQQVHQARMNTTGNAMFLDDLTPIEELKNRLCGWLAVETEITVATNCHTL